MDKNNAAIQDPYRLVEENLAEAYPIDVLIEVLTKRVGGGIAPVRDKEEEEGDEMPEEREVMLHLVPFPCFLFLFLSLICSVHISPSLCSARDPR